MLIRSFLFLLPTATMLASPCSSLTSLTIPNTTITSAVEVPAERRFGAGA